MDSYLKELDKFCKGLDKKYRDINSGGCGMFAAALGRQLEKADFDVCLRVGCSWGDPNQNLNHVKRHVKNNTVGDWNNHDVVFGHVFVELVYDGKKYHIDSTGVHEAKPRDPTFRFKLYKGYLSVQDMIELTRGMDEGDWNMDFPRKYVAPIRKAIKEFFAKQSLVYSSVY